MRRGPQSSRRRKVEILNAIRRSCSFSYLAGAFLIGEMATFVLLGEPLWTLEHPALRTLLVAATWAVWALGLVLLVLPTSTLRRHGGVTREASYIHTRNPVQTGIYALVRHPQYLGWTLMYYPLVGFKPHALLALVAVLGTVTRHRISRQEDRRLIGQFGQRYEAYMASTPGMNLLAGIVRLVRRRYIGCRLIAPSSPLAIGCDPPAETGYGTISYRKDR